MSTSAMSPAMAPTLGAQPFRTNWIISRRDDLTWFIGPAAISYLAFALMAAGFPITLIYFIWFVGVDGPHVIATVTRTYFDRQERKRLGRVLLVIVPPIPGGPGVVGRGQGSR